MSRYLNDETMNEEYMVEDYIVEDEAVEEEYMVEDYIVEDEAVEEEYMVEDYIEEDEAVEEEYMVEDYIEEDGDDVQVHSVESGPRVIFGNISQASREVVPTKLWNVKENDLGLFFIVDANEEVLSKGVQVLTRDNIQIWSSPIKKLPKDSLIVDGIEGDIYISSLALSGSNLEDEVNGNYFVTVEDSEVQSLVLKIEGLDKSNEILDEEYMCEDNVFGAEASEEGEESMLDGINKDVESTSDKNTSVETLDPCNKIFEIALKAGSFTANYMDRPQFDNNALKGADLVVEKMGEKYVVTVNNVARKPIHLFDGESPYFVFTGSVNEFINKMKLVINRNYGIESDEFNRMKKVVVTREFISEGPEYENTELLHRDDVLNRVVADNHKLIIDLWKYESNMTYGFNILYGCNNDKFLRVNGYDICKSLTNLYEDLYELINMVGKENVSLTGLSVVEDKDKLFKSEEDMSVVKVLAMIV